MEKSELKQKNNNYFDPDQINNDHDVDQKLKVSLASSQPPEPIEISAVPKPQMYSDVDWILNNLYPNQQNQNENVFEYNNSKHDN